MKSERDRILCQNIKKYRLLGKHDGIDYCRSSKAFATHLDINPNTYLKYETFVAVPNYDSLVKIATGLEVSIDKLLGYKALATNGIRFFLDDLGISFKAKHSHEYHCKEYTVVVPEEICNDIYTWERMALNKAELVIYETPSLRWNLNWLGKSTICFTEDDFEDILDRCDRFSEILKTFSNYRFVRQLIFLGMVKVHRIETGRKEGLEMMAETNEVFKFLNRTNEFIPKLIQAMNEEDYYRSRKIGGKWEESEYWKLLDEMNTNLHSEQLRKIFLETLINYCKSEGMGEIRIVRQPLKNNRRD